MPCTSLPASPAAGPAGSSLPGPRGLRSVPVDLGRRPAPTASPGPASGLVIDCQVCTHRHTATCDDCVVSFLIGREADDAVVIDADEARAVRLLADAGLVPDVRHARRVG
jgi:hypothetical protein